MDSNEGSTAEDLWTPYKELAAVVEGYLTCEGGGAPYAVHTFESVLRRHKQTFLSLLKNPAKNPVSREEIKRGITEGVNLPSIGRTLLSKELVDEAIIISDMYNVNEYLALELLHTAQRQSPRHPDLPRGLIAVLLYYDGRNAMLRALKELMMARHGVSWSISAREEVITYVTRYVDQLISDGLLNHTLDALARFTLAGELHLLQNNRALPPRKHHARLVAIIENIRKLLAGVIFSASAQRGLTRDILMRLISECKSPMLGPTGALDDISLALHMALLYALDLSILYNREDGEELAKKLPLIQDPSLIPALVDELSRSHNNNEVKGTGVIALCQLSLGLALAALKRAPQSLLRAANLDANSEILDQDEALVDAACDGKVFEYLHSVILENDLAVDEEYYQRRLHTLVTDFVVLMHSKLMEMRAKADEAARTAEMYSSEGLAPPSETGRARPFQALLKSVEALYRRDPRRLRDEYWPNQPRSGGRSATLYKFVRIFGSVSPARLVSGALRALARLCAARHTWALLQAQPPPLHVAHLMHAIHHYHKNLRTDMPLQEHYLQSSSLGASALVTPAARPGKLLVRQEEVEALMAALQLIGAVAREDAAAAIAIAEKLEWDAVNVMCGLICCQIPIQLKASLASTLEALSTARGVSNRVWLAIENAGLIPADSTRLLQDMIQVESRLGEYPLTAAMLKLLLTLCGSGLPVALGAGTREPGLDPYCRYVERVATALPAEPKYSDILTTCFKLFNLWLEQYEPSPTDVTAQPPPPGQFVAIRMHNDSELLRLVINVINDAQTKLFTCGSEEVKNLEACVVEGLTLLERGLEIEREFVQAMREAGRENCVPLTKLLLSPLSSVSSPLVLLLQCPGLGGAAARRSAAVLRRLRPVLAVPLVPPQLQRTIRHGFVELLDADPSNTEEGECIVRSQRDVVALLQDLTPAPPPNFTHYLLGYQLSHNISNSTLSEPGAGGFPRTCLHSILDILDKHIAGPENLEREATPLIEACYRLLYWLLARPATATPLLPLLRNRSQFLTRHACCTVNLETASPTTISARSWLLRALAVASGAAAERRAPLLALIQPLIHNRRESSSCLLRTLLNCEVSAREACPPQWELFNPTQLKAAIESLDLPTGEGRSRISVGRLHALLTRELAALHAAAPHTQRLQNEIQKVLDYATEVNHQRNVADTLTHYYDSWRQLVEITFCVCPPELLSLDAKKTLILNILQDLLNKIPPQEVIPQIGNLASGTVLLLLVNLRHCYIVQKRGTDLRTADFESTFFGPSNQIMQSKSLTLKFVLHKILSWILSPGGCTQKMRVNLYGALLNFLNIVNLKTSPAELDTTNLNDTFVSRLDSSKGRPNKEESALKSMVLDVISSYGDNLCAVVCSDCIGAGHDVCRMVALSCLETLVEINPQTDWMNTLTNQGYLRSLIDSLLQDDEGLKQALEPNPRTLRVLYVYESKMALLTKISSTRAGAETVLTQGALSCLANMKVFGCHPDIHTSSAGGKDTDFLPSVANRFRQILIPAMSLCNALLTTLGTGNHSCVMHVTHLLISHLECLNVVLRAAHPNSPTGLLTELEAITSVISRASNQDVLDSIHTDASLQHAAPAVERIKGLMLALANRFSGPDNCDGDDERATLYYKIVCNVLQYISRVRLDTDARASCCSASLSLLAGCVRRARSLAKLVANAEATRNEVNGMTLQDMKKLLPPSAPSAPAAETRAAAAAAAASTLHTRRTLYTLSTLVIETALSVARQQARACLTHALTTAPAVGAAFVAGHGARLTELRKQLLQVFTDRFTDDLLDTAKDQPSSQKAFLEILVKDIKNMLQFIPAEY